MSAFLDFLEWLGRPQQAVINAVTGRPLTALKHGLQAGLDVVDAFLPLDIIPDVTTPEDVLHGSEVLGLQDAHWALKLAADLGVGVLTDPLTYLSGGASAAAKAGKTIGAAKALGAARAEAVGGLTELANASLTAVKADARALRAAAKTGTPVMQPLHPQAVKAEQLRTAAASTRATLRNYTRQAAKAAAAGTPPPSREVIRQAEASAEQARQAWLAFQDTIKTDAKAAARATYAEAETIKHLPQAIERGISRDGRRALVEAGTPAETLVKDVITQLGGDTSTAKLRDVLSRPAFAPYFDQGGLRFAGRQIVAEEPLRAAVAGLAAKGAGLLPAGTLRKATDALGKAGAAISRTLGWDNAPPELAQALRKNPAIKGAQVAKAHTTFLQETLNITGIKAGSKESQALADVFDNLVYQGDQVVGPIIPDDTASVFDRIAVMRQQAPQAANWDAVEAAAQRFVQSNEEMWSELIREGAIHNEDAEGVFNYLRRSYVGEPQTAGLTPGEVLIGTDSLRGRTRKTTEELIEGLQKNPEMRLERDAVSRMLDRVTQQGRLIAQTETARELLGGAFAGLRGRTAEQVLAVAEATAKESPALGRWVADLVAARPPRGWFLGALAKANRVFKPAAVYGFIVPRFAAITGNEMSGVLQAYSGIGRDAALAEARRLPSQLWGAVANGVAKTLGKEPKFGNELAQMLRTYEDTFKAVAAQTGDFREVRKALAAKNPLLVEAMDAGVFDGFVQSEELLRRMASVPGVLQRLMDMPGEMFNGVEVGLRLGAFRDLRQGGVSAKRAADFVRESFLDYSIPNNANRTMRDLIPFAAFTAQTIKQQGKLFAERPGFMAATGHLFRHGGDPMATPEWIAGQAHLPLGEDEEGNRLFAASLRLPQEALDILPNLSGDLREIGRGVRQGLIGSAHPLIKTAFALGAGRDPYFDSPVLSYAKTPEILQAVGMPEESEVGRAYQFAKGTGLIQPAASLIDLASKALDSRKGVATRAANILTGVNIVSADEERTRIANLARQLELDPSVRSMQIFYSPEGGSEVLDQYRAAQAARRRAKDQD